MINLSPFNASVQCAGVRSSIGKDGAINAYNKCGTAKAVRGIWIGCICTLLLLLLVTNFTKNSEDELEDDSSKRRRRQISLLIILSPFILSLFYAFLSPYFSKMNYDFDTADFKASNLTDKEWINSKILDDRTIRSTSTSILCAFIIAGAGVFNTQFSYWYVTLRKKGLTL